MHVIRRVLHRHGIDVSRARPNVVDLMTALRVDTVLDVGANTGQFVQWLRGWGYRGRIVSFEPGSAAFRELEAAAARDPLWTARHEAIGRADGETVLNVSEYSVFSSVLEPAAAATDYDPRARTIARESVPIRRLDSLWSDVVAPGSRVFIKVDTQGSEHAVIAGAHESLRAAVATQLELSIRPLYEGEHLLGDMIASMQDRGLQLVFADPVGHDPRTGFVLQLDCVFARAQ